MKIYIATDHRGVNEMLELEKYLIAQELDVVKLELENDELDDYTDFAFLLSRKVASDENSIGILMCGNGIGMSIAANKVKGIRCARVVNTDDAFKARNHNGANVIAIGANLGIDTIKEVVDTFISTPPATIDRYLTRINKIISYEKGEYNEL